MLEPLTRTFTDYASIELVDYYPSLARTYTYDEQQTMAWIVEHARSNWVAVDVGAHVGVYTMLLARLCRWVHAFEACPDTYAKLLANLEHNRLGGNVIANLAVLGDVPGMHTETLWFAGRASIGKAQEETTEVEVVTLDGYGGHNAQSPVWWSYGWERLDFLKVDVDGWDLEVLRGARDTINRHRPVIVVEVNESLERRGHTVREVVDWVNEMRYTIRPIDWPAPGNWLMEPR